MDITFPESSIVNQPHEIDGPMKEAKKSFYELAKSKVKYLSDDEIKKWNKEARGRESWASPASYILSHSVQDIEGGGGKKWIHNLEIVVNKDLFHLNGKDYSDLIPLVLEHDIYEAWLTSKKGAASSLEVHQKHLLARRREWLLAMKQGLGDKLMEWNLLLDPSVKEECENARVYAKKRLKLV